MARAATSEQRLATAFEALSSATRILLLREIRSPKALKEIEVRPGDEDPKASERVIARQTVRHHLDKLLEAGLVAAREGERDYGPTAEYVLNHQAIFHLSEELRALARLRPTAEPSAETIQAGSDSRPLALRGPCLVLVNGLEPGRVFDLSPTAGTKEWVVGRRRGLDVTLDFDPSVSAENALVSAEGGTFFIQDLKVSRNGTSLNFRPLAKGERRPLATGDLIGVGRCILMFRNQDATSRP